MKVRFIEEDAETYTVAITNGAEYGMLLFDEEQGAWVLWPDTILDGITYFSSLEATKEAIEYELVNADF